MLMDYGGLLRLKAGTEARPTSLLPSLQKRRVRSAHPSFLFLCVLCVLVVNLYHPLTGGLLGIEF